MFSSLHISRTKIAPITSSPQFIDKNDFFFRQNEESVRTKSRLISLVQQEIKKCALCEKEGPNYEILILEIYFITGPLWVSTTQSDLLCMECSYQQRNEEGEVFRSVSRDFWTPNQVNVSHETILTNKK